MSPILLRLVMSLYSNQKVCTSWQNGNSSYFTCVNGVKQGGVLSPLLFTVYFDVLLKRLENAGVGCWIGCQFYGCVCYADDICLLSPSLCGLQEMVNICSNFGIEYDVIFNSSKTQCIKFKRTNDSITCNILMNGDEIKWVNHVTHLGNEIMSDLSEEKEIVKKTMALIGSVNKVVSEYNFVGSEGLNCVFNVLCTSFYGCQSWNISDQYFNKFVIAWNKCIRRIWKIPWNTHTNILPFLSDTLYIIDTIYRRIIRMYDNMKQSNNLKLKAIYVLSCNDFTSIIGRNVRTINNRYEANIDVSNFDHFANELKMKVCHTGNIVKELSLILDGKCRLNNFDEEEILYLRDFLCTM